MKSAAITSSSSKAIFKAKRCFVLIYGIVSCLWF
jgi:hypothetical protein